MFTRTINKSTSNSNTCKKLLLASALTLGIVSHTNVISESLSNANFNENSRYSNKSFITKAVEKTGSSVVTIDSQRYVKQRRFSQDSRIFIDPYFERFFGLQLPYDNQPKIEKSQGSGFIFADGLVMTNAHVVNGSDQLIVGLKNGKKLKGKLVGQDFFTDLGSIKKHWFLFFNFFLRFSRFL